MTPWIIRSDRPGRSAPGLTSSLDNINGHHARRAETLECISKEQRLNIILCIYFLSSISLLGTDYKRWVMGISGMTLFSFFIQSKDALSQTATSWQCADIPIFLSVHVRVSWLLVQSDGSIARAPRLRWHWPSSIRLRRHCLGVVRL